MRRATRVLGVVVALFSAVALSGARLEARTASDQGRGRGQTRKAAKAEDKRDKDRKDEKAGAKHDGVQAVAVDRDGHVRIIHEYARSGSLPPGLAKRQALPPGLREQLRETGQLPPGLQKRLVVVPPALSRRLPPVPPYYHRYFAGDDLLVIDSRSNQVVAIIRDIWR